MAAMTQIYLVDDDSEIQEMLKSALEFANYQVSLASDGVTALTMVRNTPPDLIILDVMMPRFSGFDFLQILRSFDMSTPVLLLTARDGIDDRVKGLRAGADDYVTKPFSVMEVVARIEALLRRSRIAESQQDAQSTTDDMLQCGPLTIDAASHQVSEQGVPIELTPTEYRLLLFLVAHRGKVISKSQILAQVWDMSFSDDTNVVERFVSSLRKKIELHGVEIIRTVRGFGYMVATDAQMRSSSAGGDHDYSTELG